MEDVAHLKKLPIHTTKINAMTRTSSTVPIPPSTIWKWPFSFEPAHRTRPHQHRVHTGSTQPRSSAHAPMTRLAVRPTKLCGAVHVTTAYSLPRFMPHV